MAFEGLAEKLQAVFKKLTQRGKLSEKDVKDALREVRLALLEADVNYLVVKDFLKKVQERAVGQEVLSALTPGQMVIKIVNEELTALMGGQNARLELQQRPAVILLVGLQGAGKTTLAGKLGGLLKKQGKKPLLAACDVYRPAAIEQLKIVGQRMELPVFEQGRKVYRSPSLEEIRAEIEKQIDRFPALSELSLMQRNVVISQLLEEYSRLCSMELCENTLIDAVIFSKKTRADAFGIHMSCALALPERIAVSPVDLISVFANLLDNAIEGSLLMPPEKRMILVSAAVKADCLIVTVANHKPASLHVRTEGMASSKGEGHGLGLGILRQIAERYDGSFSCEDSGERVEFSIMLPLLESRTER